MGQSNRYRFLFRLLASRPLSPLVSLRLFFPILRPVVMFRDNNARHVSTSFSRIFHPLFHNSNRTGPDENSFNGFARKTYLATRFRNRPPFSADDYRPIRARIEKYYRRTYRWNFLSLKFDHFCERVSDIEQVIRNCLKLPLIARIEWIKKYFAKFENQGVTRSHDFPV